MARTKRGEVMAHTPGPWTIHFGDGKDGAKGVAYIRSAASCKPEVAVIYRDDHRQDDAHLIAAAPDLLAAVKSVIAWFDALKADQHEKLVHHQTLESASKNWETMTTPPFDFTPLIAAIAKTEGR